MEVKGQIVAGKTGHILIREKSGEKLEVGALLVIEEDGAYLILQVYELLYGSQIRQSARELLAGMRLEGYGTGLDFFEPELRNYVLAEAKGIARVSKEKGKTKVTIPKTLPSFFKAVRHIKKKDLGFLTKPPNPIYVGRVRSGSKILDVDVFLNGNDIFTHHVLVPATTGRGKSNLVKVMLWSALGLDNSSALVLDPHDEYYGRHRKGLKDHSDADERLLYYSPNAPTGQNTLVINLRSIVPDHFSGIVNFTPAQWDAIRIYHNRFKKDWIAEIVKGTVIEGVDISPRTLGVLRRKFDVALGVYLDEEGNIQSRNRIFSTTAGETVTKDIVRALEEGKTVVLDTSRLLDEAELLIGSIIAGAIFNRYQTYKSKGKLEDKPVVAIIIEEAPRVLSGEVLAAQGENIYSTIAREGRKFNVGLIAISQLISLIPKTILANLNTKIILGNEMAPERAAVIGSASQDLSDDDRTIASLDKGEAIVSSIFTKFAIPIQIPLFEDYITKIKGKEKIGKMAFEEMVKE